MTDLPKFLLYGEDDPRIEDSIQSKIPFRDWGALTRAEKEVALQQLENAGYLSDHSSKILSTISFLNFRYLRLCPGKRLHKIAPQGSTIYGTNNDFERMRAAVADFGDIFLAEANDALVLRILSKFAQEHINDGYYSLANKEKSKTKRCEYLDQAYEKFDNLAAWLNHIFEQFAVNQTVTRSGIVPRQDKLITDQIYTPTIRFLSDPKWRTVSDDLGKMFEDYSNRDYAEAITKAHSAVHRFLQVLVGEEGKSGKGEVSKLFSKAKSEGMVPINRFTEPLINVLQGFIPSERATNSTAKPALKEATASDALLMMNIVMVFLQHCLQGGH